MNSASNRLSDLVTGGAGFVGSSLAARLASSGRQVTVLDNFSRPGSDWNAHRLRQRYPEYVRVIPADIRDANAVRAAAAGATRIFHCAGQVAVTTSLRQPMLDHAVNTLGTLNLLEAARLLPDPPSLIFTSTNKVYGDLGGLTLRRTEHGYQPVDAAIRANGIDEQQPLAFHSAYGCSKGAADQYVLDYARTFGLSTAVLRMSCIYGPHQQGTEDQGWVAHLARSSLLGAPITLYGDGYQVRDILYIDDLVEAALTVADHLPGIAGEVFNVGGGPDNTLSLRTLLHRLESARGAGLHPRTAGWRAGDQRYYSSNCTRLHRLTGWKARISVDEGLARLLAWLQQHAEPTHQRSLEQARRSEP